jgi:TolB-like protein/DNA-binding winged helix-turn-helix (wHTH) protein/cytochrome c-type biogenesis protein CcmH/NrfG
VTKGRISRIDDLIVDHGKREVRRADENIELPRLSYQLLIVLADAAPNVVTQEELIEQVWGGRIVSPETVTQRVKLLRQALGDDAQNPRYIALARGQGYRLIAPVESVESQTAPASEQGLLDHRSRPQLRRAAPLLILAALGGLSYLIYSILVPDKSTVRTSDLFAEQEIQPNSIAVLPFANLGAADQDDWLAAGLGDELRAQLVRTEGLRVAARTSSIAMAEQVLDAQTMGRHLGVRLLVEGSVRRQDNALRVSLSVIDTRSGFANWSTTYERNSRDLLAIQKQIALDVIANLGSGIDVDPRATEPATTDVTAYELMLLGRHYEYQVKETPETDVAVLERAIDLYRRAVQADPDYAVAWGRLGAALLYRGAVDEAEDAIYRALTIDPDLAQVQRVLGDLLWLRRRDGAGEAYEKALARNPEDADTLRSYAWYIWHRPDNTTPGQYYRQALSRDRLSLARYADLGHFYGITGRVEQTEAVIDEIDNRFSTAAAYSAIAHLQELIGAVDDAILSAREARRLEPENPVFPWQLAELHARIGDLETAAQYERQPSLQLLYRTRRFDELITLAEKTLRMQPGDSNARYLLAAAYNATGRFESSRDVLETAGLPEIALHETRRASDTTALADYAVSLARTGEVARARELAEWLLWFMQTHLETDHRGWWPHAYKACALLVLGRREEGLAAIGRIRGSPRLPFVTFLETSPCFSDIAQEAEYRSMLETVIARQEKLLIAVRRLGEAGG